VGSPSIAPPRTCCRLAEGGAELERHFAIRRAVFVEEQRLFAGDDRDALDDDAATLHAVGLAGGAVAGAVRLYPLPDGGWKGDRLAVVPSARRGLLGAALVRFAVASAGERGGSHMVAMIQPANVAFFRSLGWHVDGEQVTYHGRPHQPMAISF
jgi:putative N-acetyltransferase (TIGR04045 family)